MALTSIGTPAPTRRRTRMGRRRKNDKLLPYAILGMGAIFFVGLGGIGQLRAAFGPSQSTIEPGIDGAPGAPGTDGAPGIDGAAGIEGPAGAPGAPAPGTAKELEPAPGATQYVQPYQQQQIVRQPEGQQQTSVIPSAKAPTGYRGAPGYYTGPTHVDPFNSLGNYSTRRVSYHGQSREQIRNSETGRKIALTRAGITSRSSGNQYVIPTNTLIDRLSSGNLIERRSAEITLRARGYPTDRSQYSSSGRQQPAREATQQRQSREPTVQPRSTAAGRRTPSRGGTSGSVQRSITTHTTRGRRPTPSRDPLAAYRAYRRAGN